MPAGSFTDVDGSPLSYSATLASGAALPAWLNFDVTTQRFTGTPPANFNGFIDVRVAASDGALSTSDEFRLTVTPVNDAPVAVGDGGFSVAAGSSLTIAPTALLANDSDVDGNILTITAAGNAVGGTVLINAQGQIVFTPTLTSAGSGSFRYTVSDGSITATANVGVQITASGVPWVYGTPGNDNIFGVANMINRIDGGAGNDTITGDSLNDELVGGTIIVIRAGWQALNVPGNDIGFDWVSRAARRRGLENHFSLPLNLSPRLHFEGETKQRSQSRRWNGLW